MFAVFKDKGFVDFIWGKLTSDEFISPDELNLEFIETFNPELLRVEDIHLFFLDAEEGIIGKVTLSHTSRFSENMSFISIDQPLKDSAMIIRDVDYHINCESHIHEDAEGFEALTHEFYKDILKNSLWVCRKLSIKTIITISNHIDDHEDFAYWGNFKFSTCWETLHNVLGIISHNIDKDNQVQESESFVHSIKFISYATLQENNL